MYVLGGKAVLQLIVCIEAPWVYGLGQERSNLLIFIRHSSYLPCIEHIMQYLRRVGEGQSLRNKTLRILPLFSLISLHMRRGLCDAVVGVSRFQMNKD